MGNRWKEKRKKKLKRKKKEKTLSYCVKNDLVLIAPSNNLHASLSNHNIKAPYQTKKPKAWFLARSLMASLRLPCCLSSKTPSFSINPITPKLSSLHNHPNNFTFNTNTNNISLSHSLCFPIRNNNKFRHFLLHFSSTTQDHPVVDSSSLDDVVTEYQSKAEEKEEEFSKTRLFASNVPWNCTAEDIRALFQKFGTVVDVEVGISVSWIYFICCFLTWVLFTGCSSDAGFFFFFCQAFNV